MTEDEFNQRFDKRLGHHTRGSGCAWVSFCVAVVLVFGVFKEHTKRAVQDVLEIKPCACKIEGK